MKLAPLTMLFLSAQFALAQDALPIQLVDHSENGQTFRAISFDADFGHFYRIQKSTDLTTWTDFLSFDGYGDTALFPFVEINAGGSGGGSGGGGPTVPSVFMHLQTVDTGGTLVSWRSLADGWAVQHHLPSLTLVSEWSSIPFFYKAATSFNYFITRTVPATTALPGTLPTLQTEDQTFIDAFVLDYPSVEPEVVAGNTQDVVFAVPPAAPSGGGEYYRIAAELSDKDRDGITDILETTLTSEGGTETDPNNPDSDGDGYWDGAEVAQIKDPNDENEAPDEAPGGGGGGGVVIVAGGHIEEVGFHENYELTSDNQKVNYRVPHWKSESHNYPVSYTRSKTITLSAKFILDALNPGDAASVTVTGPNGIKLPSTPLDHVGGQVWELSPTNCPANQNGGTLPDTIKFYNAQDENNVFELDWVVTAGDPEASLLEETTKHTVYVTHSDPSKDALLNRDVRQETVFNIGCRNADGMSVEEGVTTTEAIADAIYDEFENRSVARVKPTQGALRVQAMTYWGNPTASACITGEKLLASQDGDGNCEAWSYLFHDILKAQGFTPVRKKVKPNRKHPALPQEDRFVVNNAFAGAPDQTLPGPYWWLYGVNLTVDTTPGIAGQGETEPIKYFTVHYVLEYENTLYDPSYGSSFAGAGRVKDWEDDAIGYYGFLITVQNAEGNDVPLIHMRQNDTTENTTAEVTLIPSPPLE